VSRLGWFPAGPVCPGIVPRLNPLILVATLATAGLSRSVHAQEGAGDQSRSSQLPQLMTAVNPIYPDSLKDLGIEGTVILQAAIDTSGQVDRSTVKVVKSLQPDLDQACVEALVASRFAPATYGGRPVRVVMQIPYTFNVEETPADSAGADSVPSPADADKDQ
jgi:TonB family protein